MAESEEELKSLLMKVIKESEKVGLKLNIHKTKIMASGPITSWEIDGESLQMVTAAMKLKDTYSLEPIKNLVIVSGGKDGDLAIGKHVSILSTIPLLSRLPHHIEQNSLYHIIGPCWLSILNIAVCTCQSQTP